MTGFGTVYRSCRNPLCLRKLGGGAAYCCAPCTRAHEGGYEIHESGLLAHDPRCEARVRERGGEFTWPEREAAPR